MLLTNATGAPTSTEADSRAAQIVAGYARQRTAEDGPQSADTLAPA